MEDRALLSSRHSIFWYSPSTWSLFVYYLFKEQRNRLSTPRQWGNVLSSHFHKAAEGSLPPVKSYQIPKFEESPSMSSEAVSLFCNSPSWGRINFIIPSWHILHSGSIFNSQQLNFPCFYMMKLNSNHMGIKICIPTRALFDFRKKFYFTLKYDL